ncbi:MAG: hypothetical protein EOO43_05115 [Flavobacterium sp.]|nr:MAG: hypothetical protein EOO43_05115 [Flavobacterium sp.]
MINCYVISDYKTIQTLEKHINKFTLTKLSGYSTTEEYDIEQISACTPKIVFVDIELLKTNRPTLIRLGQEYSIVYLAETKAYAYDAFEANALDYILRPLNNGAFEKSINKFISFSLLAPPKQPPVVQINHRIESITDSFFIKSDFRGQKELLIKCNDVLFIEAEQNYVVLRTHDKKFICHNTLKEMEESLPNRYFIRVHKSYIINYDKITSVEGNVIILDNNETFRIQIGSTYKKAFFERKSHKIIRKKNYFDLVGYSKYAALLLCITSLLENGDLMVL